MTLLIDTQVLLWFLAADPALAGHNRETISNSSNSVLVSAASAWEIAIKKKLGKLSAPDGLLEAVEASGLEWIPITPSEANAAGSLPMHHRDPFDRLLVAQAVARSANLISSDAVFDQYGVRREWA